MWQKLRRILSRVEKPARYIGNELNIVVKPSSEVDLRFALAFPDLYDIGTSYMGFQILYDILNNIPGVQAERVFAPWPDMEAEMRKAELPLYGLESKTPLTEFDIIGFTLQFELGYTNLLNMLDLAGISPRARDRNVGPLIVAGGPGASNPEPMADFVDVFVIGEGEEVVAEIVHQVREAKRAGLSKAELLQCLMRVDGIYVPCMYTPQYDEVGYIGTQPTNDAPARVRKRIIKDFANFPLPKQLVMPLIQPVHDRVSVEICRGCARGCRFCQAGMLYRPVRERPQAKILEQSAQLLQCTGSPEISLSSLSSADYSDIEILVREMMDKNKVGVSLPSLRVDSYSVQMARLTGRKRKSGLTLAPEAGSQRLRDVINKNVRDEDIFSAARTAFENGWQTIKLYFMLGLPTETEDDIRGISLLVHGLEGLYREIHGHTKRLKINLGVSTFVPKPHTPFQWAPQLERESVEKRQRLLKELLRSRKFHVNTTNWSESSLEAALAKGDRRLGAAIYLAWKKGCRFDAWSEHLRSDLWKQAFVEAGIDPGTYTSRHLPLDQPLPWDHIDVGVDKEFLIRELHRAYNGKTTPDCTLTNCSACGICSAYALTPWKRGNN